MRGVDDLIIFYETTITKVPFATMHRKMQDKE
jgi:hypothetical protein